MFAVDFGDGLHAVLYAPGEQRAKLSKNSNTTKAINYSLNPGTPSSTKSSRSASCGASSASRLTS